VPRQVIAFAATRLHTIDARARRETANGRVKVLSNLDGHQGLDAASRTDNQGPKKTRG
jgi:hypothetical protein